MNLNQRRPLSHTGARMVPGTRNAVEMACKQSGVTLTVKRLNVGEWNDCREFWAGDQLLAVVMKGERVKWDDLLREMGELTN